MTGTVAITGATGFIGRHIADSLLAQGFTLRALTRRPQGTVNNLTWVAGTLEQSDALAELVRGADYVVHCAGQVRGWQEASFMQANVSGSQRLMQAAIASGVCQRFLLMSSLAARHPHLSWYAKSKYLAEQRLTNLTAGITFGIFRPTAVYGPGDKELKPVFRWLLRGLLPQTGPADARLSFLHVSDLAAAVGQWLTAAQPPPGPCELCDGVEGGYSWPSLQATGARVREGPVRLIGIPLPLLKGLADLSVLASRIAGREPMLTRSKIHELTHQDWSASNVRFSEHTGWLPAVTLEHALRAGLF
ncbi:NAD-dependent epimerase/dehydratase family protein [Erwinia persicina]|uniref:NAD-dependent epimerase/dehydratase family protein n=1 Tax=Erwinia persicina TaxID=55211 RepID=UPI00177F841B|nr:NAD-dependent epimerase/dehydratase family protein [Erwinia persicina]MBD8215865.1 NAD-dependent epimerase/dehydratase family protein [Erwinia persicina]